MNEIMKTSKRQHIDGTLHWVLRTESRMLSPPGLRWRWRLCWRRIVT